jgi:hypothetical protein
MPNDDPNQPIEDGMHPPAIPTEVFCLHCNQVYESYLIEWRVHTNDRGERRGFWCCPIPGCGGTGFGFDIFPTDPDYQDERGIGWNSGEDDEDECDEDFDVVDDLPEGTNGHADRPPDVDSDIPY